MIISNPYMTREDGVKLIQKYSGIQNDDGSITRTNFMLHKIGTDEYYANPIDIEDAPWEYEETDIPVDEEEMLEDREGISDAEFRQLVEEAL